LTHQCANHLTIINSKKMQQFDELFNGRFYHIYNQGINGCDLFSDPATYQHFMLLYDKYIYPIADTFAWVLMRNHFHLLVKIKENVVYKYSGFDSSKDADRCEDNKWETIDLLTSTNQRIDSVKMPSPQLHFSHFFNAYSRYFNKRFNRKGALFQRRFRRKIIGDESYFKNIVMYIHNNPVHHGFCEHPMEYPWSSYQSCISVKPTKLQRNQVIGWFDDLVNFKLMHNGNPDIDGIEKWLDLD
jgi:putative transposase